MNGELLSILDAIERDKGISREVLIQAVESALATAARKTLSVPEEQEVTVTIDRDSGTLRVAADGHNVTGLDFSRIAAQTAKQVIIQKIREAEREVVYSEFQGRVGDIVTGTVHRFERGDVIVELGRAEAILPKSERIPREEYQQGERLQGYVLEVQKTLKGPAIVLSRTHEGFIRGLFAIEVPEISEGIVLIRAITREAGDRTKIAVSSTEDKVDCVGACVGMRGTRVKNIVRELHGEKIDIIRWQEDVREFIAAALQPAKISTIELDEGGKRALVIVDDDQLSLAIGKRGQNVRLASKLTGWELEIKSKSQMAIAERPIAELEGVGPTIESRLREAGVTTILQVARMSLEQLQQVPSIGPKTAQKLIDAAQQAMSARPSEAPPPAVEPAPAGEAEAASEAEPQDAVPDPAAPDEPAPEDAPAEPDPEPEAETDADAGGESPPRDESPEGAPPGPDGERADAGGPEAGA